MYDNVFWDFFKEVIIPTVVISLLVVLIATIPSYYASCRKAEVFNKANQTNYTCSDFFWAENQINSQTQTINLHN